MPGAGDNDAEGNNGRDQLISLCISFYGAAGTTVTSRLIAVSTTGLVGKKETLM